MKRVFLFLSLALVLASCAGKKDNYQVFLLIGQSNMAGRGTLLEEDYSAEIEGVYLLDSLDTPVPATHPFNQYSTIRKNISMQQMGPGYAFSTAVREATGKPVLLVVNARGGSGLDSWMPGSEYMNEAVRRTRQACRYGELKAIIWHQGCTDADKGLTSTYLSRLSVMVDALRDSLSTDVPFIAGEVARWNSYATDLNAQINAVPDVIPNSAVVSSEGAGMLRDEKDPHFNREGQILLGKRYAEKYLEFLK